MTTWVQWIERAGHWAPAAFAGLFIAVSLLMIWRLEAISRSGLRGTVLGTLVLPYCSGMGNLIFTILMARKGGSGAEVMTNCLVNNVTNMTLVLGLVAGLWGMRLVPGPNAKARSPRVVMERRIDRLSLLLALIAVAFFTGVVWVLSSDGRAPTSLAAAGCAGRLDFADGLVLVGLFLFWQLIHVFEVLKTSVREQRPLRIWLALDLVVLLACAYVAYVSVDWLVNWVLQLKGGFIAKHYGWVSAWLMVLPNATLAFYYGWAGRPEVVYTSQVSDGHICIPLCVGLYALHRTLVVPPLFVLGAALLLGAALVHFLCVTLLGGLPRLIGWALVGAYALFVYKGILP
ncbi:MAG: sodium:calcium symporter [Verrucomicrobiae bacterium]|nr:sodium:calcium symporter [Verrucomicrobiae bacterium]